LTHPRISQTGSINHQQQQPIWTEIAHVAALQNVIGVLAKSR
jgi:hypothetical protein